MHREASSLGEEERLLGMPMSSRLRHSMLPLLPPRLSLAEVSFFFDTHLFSST